MATKTPTTPFTGNYIALYVHYVWTTKYREPVLFQEARYALLDHIWQVAVAKEIRLCIINGVEDHLHALVALRATQSVASVIKQIKGESSRWVNAQNVVGGLFNWQDGYGAISVSPQHIPRVTRYIFGQEQHHYGHSLDEELETFALYAG